MKLSDNNINYDLIPIDKQDEVNEIELNSYWQGMCIEYRSIKEALWFEILRQYCYFPSIFLTLKSELNLIIFHLKAQVVCN